MRVALDATPLVLTSGGLRRYVEELSRALAREFPDDAFALISDQSVRLGSSELPANLHVPGNSGGVVDRKWWLTGAARATKRNNTDVFHGTNFEVPLLRVCPSVMTIHDLSPWKNSEFHPRGTRARNRTPLLLRMRLANLVITPSEAVRREVMETFGLAADRVFAVPLAAASHFFPRGVAGTPRASAKPYFLFTGTIEPRKNLPLLLTAWREVRKRWNVPLIVVGRTREDSATLGEEPGLQVLGEVSDDELAVLYAGATGFIYPSFYEGFGLPVLEAMQSGAPVVISRDAALQEVAGGAALTADTVAELVAAMTSLLTNCDLAPRLRQQGLERAFQFSWGKTARMTHAVYEEALGRFA